MGSPFNMANIWALLSYTSRSCLVLVDATIIRNRKIMVYNSAMTSEVFLHVCDQEEQVESAMNRRRNDMNAMTRGTNTLSMKMQSSRGDILTKMSLVA